MITHRPPSGNASHRKGTTIVKRIIIAAAAVAALAAGGAGAAVAVAPAAHAAHTGHVQATLYHTASPDTLYHT